MQFKVIGKQKIHSNKKDKDFFILHTFRPSDGVEGFAVKTEFVDSSVFDKASCGSQYNVVYDCDNFGKAVISDLQLVAKE